MMEHSMQRLRTTHRFIRSEAGSGAREATPQLRTVSPADVDRPPGTPGAVYSVECAL